MILIFPEVDSVFNKLICFDCFFVLVKVRLVDGSSPLQGRVEISRKGVWGTVCGQAWTLKEARVICRMLNLSDAFRAMKHSFFGRGSGQIWLTGVQCTGLERSLTECKHADWGETSSCSHSNDVGVICGRPACKFNLPLSFSFEDKRLSWSHDR